ALDAANFNFQNALELKAQAEAKYANNVLTGQNAVDKEQETLRKAQDDLATKTGGGDQKAILKAQNNVTSAQAAVDKTKVQLEQATIRAPFDGIIAAVGANPGDRVQL